MKKKTVLMVSTIFILFVGIASATVPDDLARVECSPEVWGALEPGGLDEWFDNDDDMDLRLNGLPCAGTGRGSTPLQLAARYVRYPELVETLADLGADVTMTDATGATALDYARANPYDAEGVLAVLESFGGEFGESQPSSEGAKDSERRNYMSVGAGWLRAMQMDSSLHITASATKCDALIYSDPAMVSASVCMAGDREVSITSSPFALGNGSEFDMKVGRSLGKARVEFQFRNRNLGSDQGAIYQNRNSETSHWSNIYSPRSRLSGYNAQDYFGNVYLDKELEDSFVDRVSAGVGAGVSRIGAHYRRSLLRKTLPQGFSFPEQTYAPGTLTELEHQVDDTLFGLQGLFGLEWDLGERSSVGSNFYWARLMGETRGESLYSTVRSHEPVTPSGAPFIGRVGLDKKSYFGLTLDFKLRF